MGKTRREATGWVVFNRENIFAEAANWFEIEKTH
jgi:hypothetical protein